MCEEKSDPVDNQRFGALRRTLRFVEPESTDGLQSLRIANLPGRKPFLVAADFQYGRKQKHLPWLEVSDGVGLRRLMDGRTEAVSPSICRPSCETPVATIVFLSGSGACGAINQSAGLVHCQQRASPLLEIKCFNICQLFPVPHWFECRKATVGASVLLQLCYWGISAIHLRRPDVLQARGKPIGVEGGHSFLPPSTPTCPAVR